MTSRKLTLEDEFEALKKKCKFLLAGEGITLALSFFGTIATIFTKQAAFAATPLTFSIFLNIISRYYQDQQVALRSTHDLIEAQRQYGSKLQSLRSEFLGADFTEEIGEDSIDRGEYLQELATKVQQLESFLEIQGGDYYSQGGALNQEVSILRNHQLEMAEAIETLTSQIESPSTPEQIDIIDNLERLSAAVYELEQKTESLDSILKKADSKEPGSEIYSADLNGSSQDHEGKIQPLQAQMIALQERMDFIATADPAYDEEAIQSNIQALVNPLREQISVFEAQLQELKTQTETSQMTTMGTSPTNEEFDEIRRSIDALNLKLEDSLAQISADINDFQSSLQQTHEQMNEVQQQIHIVQDLATDSLAVSKPEVIAQQIEALNAPIREQFNEIQHKLAELNQLQGQLEHVQYLADETAKKLQPETVEAQILAVHAPLLEKVAAVESKVTENLSAQNVIGEIQDAITPLQTHMVSLEERINQVSLQVNPQALLDKIASVQDHLHTLETRLANLPNQTQQNLDNLGQLSHQVSEMQQRLDSVSEQVTHQLEKVPALVENNVQKKVDLFADFEDLSPEPSNKASKEETKHELDDLLNSLNL